MVLFIALLLEQERKVAWELSIVNWFLSGHLITKMGTVIYQEEPMCERWKVGASPNDRTIALIQK